MSEGKPRELSGTGCRLDLSIPRVMGILNVTPDSFSDGGDYDSTDRALIRARQMIAEGADLLDIGGESTRPGSEPVSAEQETARVIPVIEALRRENDIPISVDTTKSSVAAAALAAGADFVNDVSAMTFDPAMASVVAAAGAGVFLMHTRGTPQTMQADTRYENLVTDVERFLCSAVDRALQAGIAQDAISLDVGIGFGKDLQGNLLLLRELERFCNLGYPVLLGTSRKSFLGRILDKPDPKERLYGSLCTVALGVAAGVALFRVHDVRQTKETILTAHAICRG